MGVLLSRGVVQLALIVSVMLGAGLLDQVATAGELMTAFWPIGAMVSSVMDRARWTAHASFCSSSSAPTRRAMASSFGGEGRPATGPKDGPKADDLGSALDFTVC